MEKTKVEAIADVMRETGGQASLQDIYQKIGRYYPKAKADTAIGQAGIRGVLYREIRNGQTFKKVGDAVYALTPVDEKKLRAFDTVVDVVTTAHNDGSIPKSDYQYVQRVIAWRDNLRNLGTF